MNRLLLAIALIAFAVRGLIPAGWMPTGERGFAITICTGVDTHTVWLDSEGKLHKQDPSKTKAPDPEPCAFGGLAIVANMPDHEGDAFMAPLAPAAPAMLDTNVSIGKGLAAPPPPATGPPILI